MATALVLLLANLAPLAADAVTTSVPVGTNPTGVAINPDSGRVYVANRGSNSVTVIDAATNAVVTTIPEGGIPTAVAVNPRTNRVYVTNLIQTVSVIDGATNTVVGSVPVGLGPFSIAVNPETDRAYVANLYDHTLTVIDTTTNSVVATIETPDGANGVAVNARTNRVYLTNGGANSVTVLDGATNTVVASAATASSPYGVAVNADANRLYVTTNPTLTVFDATTLEVIATVDTQGGTDIALDVQRELAYYGGFGKVSVVDMRTNTALGFVDIGTFMAGIAANPRTGKVYVPKYFANSVAVIALSDVSGPTITPSVTPAPNASGWNKDSVTLTWDVSDADSGISATNGCGLATFTAGTQGTFPTICTATNGDGLSGSGSVRIKIDKTPPTIYATATTASGSSYFPGSWIGQAVIVRYTCFDLWLPTVASSFLASCTGDQTFSEEGSFTATGTATDNADNRATATLGPIRIDRTPPTITARAATSDGTPYIAGAWTDQTVTVHYDCADAVSGVTSCTGDQVFSFDGSADGTTAAGSAMDNARLTSTTTFGPIRIDRSAPTISAAATTATGAPYDAGSWTNQVVTVRYSCADALSGIASCTADQTLSDDGITASTSGTATDNVGRTASASFGPIQIDRAAPTIAFSGNAGTYEVDQTITITCQASDSASGIETTSCPTVAAGPATDYLGTSSSTSVTLTATASDNAGNQASATTSFNVAVTSDGICRLTASLRHADNLCTRVRSIANAPNAMAKAGELRAFDNFVATQADISEDLATLLGRLARLV